MAVGQNSKLQRGCSLKSKTEEGTRERKREKDSGRERAQGNNRGERKGDWMILRKMEKEKDESYSELMRKKSNGDMAEQRDTRKKANRVV